MGKKKASFGSPGAAAAAAGAATGEAPGAPSSAPRSARARDPLEALIHRFERMSASPSTKKCGFNFNCMFPYIWYTFVFKGCEYVVYDFLLWSTDRRDVQVNVSSCHKKLHITNKILGVFLNKVRVQRRYGIADANVDDDHLLYHAAAQHFDSLIEHFAQQPLQPGFTIDLPFACQTNFHDPYFPNGPGYAIKFYTHDHAANPVEPCAHRVCIMTVVLESTKKANNNAGTAETGDIDV